jgi:TetR/AcrR family transcriptional regulator, transcriptional repressor for nem operon
VSVIDHSRPDGQRASAGRLTWANIGNRDAVQTDFGTHLGMIKLAAIERRRSPLGGAVDLRAVVDIEDVDDAAVLADLVDDAVGAAPGAMTASERPKQRLADLTSSVPGDAIGCPGVAVLRLLVWRRFVLERSFLYGGLMPRPREFEPDKVLDSAMRQFWERGYRATSVDDLVRATGVKPGSLYAAFPGGKHALLMGSLERYSRLVVPQKLGELEEPEASVAQVRAYFDGLVRDLLSPEGRQGCLLVNSAIENAAADPEVAAVVRGHLARLERNFTAALRTAIRRGEVPASVDPVSRAKGLVAASQGLMVIGKANPDEEVLRAIVDSAFTGLS